ncbi:MAG: ABC transporter substrate-binding protein [Nitrospinota bacterium]
MAENRNFSRRTFIGAMAAAGGALAVAGMTRPEAARAAKPSGKPVKIGHMCVLSGVLGGYGQFMQMGATLAAEEINAAGGILGRPLEFQFRDDQVKPDVGVKNARYFVDEWGADFVAGIDSSGVALAVAKVMPQLNKILMITHGATEKVNEELVYKEGIKQVFRISVPVYQDGIASAMIAKDLPVKRWATISPKYEYGYTSWEMFKNTLKRFRPDAEFVEESWAPFGTTDFGPHISKVMGANPEGIFTTEWAGEAVALVKQAKLFGVFGKIKEWLNPMGAAMDVLEGLGKDYPEGLWVSSRYWFLYPPTGINQSFVERFHKRWSKYPHYSSETSYSAYWALKRACELAGSTETDKVIKALEDLTLITPAGRRWFRKEDHQAVYEVPWGRTKEDPKYPFRILGDMRTVPAEMYYRHPPFTA